MEINNFIMESVLPLACGLWVFGFIILKPSKIIKDKFIPIILCILGILGGIVLISIQQNGDIVTGIIQGVLATGLSIMGSQIIKQANKGD